MAESTTPPATMLSKKFLRDGETPDSAASAMSGMIMEAVNAAARTRDNSLRFDGLRQRLDEGFGAWLVVNTFQGCRSVTPRPEPSGTSVGSATGIARRINYWSHKPPRVLSNVFCPYSHTP
ncbi:hypothetical protein PTKIN_Ptkin19aG0098500 [Pterospermum kingtungense]